MFTTEFDQFIPEPPGQRSDKPIEIAAACRDMDDAPRVPRAGQVEVLEDGTRVQLMHNGLAAQSHYRGVFGGVREIGDRVTGGGLRSLAKRVLTTLVQRSMRHRGLLALGRFLLKPFPKLAISLYQLATRSEPTAVLPTPPPAALPDGPLPSNASVIAAALPASARSIYLKLRDVMSDADARSRNP